MNPGFSSADLTLHQIHRKRYALCNDQVRRVPVAFSVVIDQAYRNDILTAVANSRLRIQTAQVHWRHRDAVAQAPGTGPNYYQPPPDMFGMGGGLPPPEGQPETRTGGIPGIGLAPGGMPTGMPGDETPMPTADVQVEGNRNLIELSVYGIATLYERHPPKEKTDGTPPMTP